MAQLLTSGAHAFAKLFAATMSVERSVPASLSTGSQMRVISEASMASPLFPLLGAAGAHALLAGTGPAAGAPVSPDVRVTRVTRIHNRLLRNRFEEQLEQIFTEKGAEVIMPKIESRESGKIDFSKPPITFPAMMVRFLENICLLLLHFVSLPSLYIFALVSVRQTIVDSMSSQYKKHLEYLFYALDPADPTQLIRAVEHGFGPLDEQQPSLMSLGAGDQPTASKVC
jgi:hypothetical protein